MFIHIVSMTLICYYKATTNAVRSFCLKNTHIEQFRKIEKTTKIESLPSDVAL